MSSILQARKLLFVVALFVSVCSSAQTTLVVDDCNLNSWMITNSGTSTATLVNGPGAVSPRQGSIRFSIGQLGVATDKNLDYSDVQYDFQGGQLFSSFTSLGYSTYIQSMASAGQTPYITVDIGSDQFYFQPRYQAGNAPEANYIYTPPVQNSGQIKIGTWQTWNAFVGGWFSANQVSANPTVVKIRSLSDLMSDGMTNPTIYSITISAGQGNNWGGFVGNADAVTVGISGATTTYYFKSCSNVTDPGVQCTNPQTFYRDADGDGFGSATDSVKACTAPPGYVSNKLDCNDNDSTVKTGTTFWRDQDGDGYGDPWNTVQACSQPKGYVSNDWDCNDYSKAADPQMELVYMCYQGKASCVAIKDVSGKKALGWTLGPCTNTTACTSDRTLLCHDGKPECVPNKDVTADLKNTQHFGLYPCGTPICASGQTVLCHDGHGECVNNSNVQNNLKDAAHWSTYPCNPARLITSASGVSASYTLTNYPNPLNNFTRIEYSLPADSKVVLKVYDLIGREISSLVNTNQSAGNYMIDYNATKLSEGVYYYKLSATANGVQHVASQKMIVTH